MIGEPTIDPSLGDKRRKALLAALQQASTMTSAPGRSNGLPAYGAVGHGSVSGFGIRSARMGGRPAAILNFLSMRGPQGYARGLAAFQQAANGLGSLIADPQAPTPIPPQSGQGGSVGTPGGSIPSSYTGGGSGFISTPQLLQQTANALNTEDPNKAIPAQVTPQGSVFEGSLPSYTSGATNTGSGLIPLGGGMFLDPDTGVLHGSGTVSGGLRA